MNHSSPNDTDPPWSEGPPTEPERCAACGTPCDVTGESERITETCGGCGFKWGEIAAAVRCVRDVALALGIDLTTFSPGRLQVAVDAALGEMIDPGL